MSVASILDLAPKFKGLFSKPYLAAGLLPAALVWLLWEAWCIGPLKVPEVVTGWVNQATAAALGVDLITAGLWLLGLGLFFFGARGVLLSVTQDMGHPLPGWLRRWSVRRQKKKFLKLEKVLEEEQLVLPFRVSAVLWAIRAFPLGFHWPPLPPNLRRRDEGDHLIFSSEGRRIMRALLPNAERPSPRQELVVVSGLCALAVNCRQDQDNQQTHRSQPWQSEHEKWKRLLDQPGAMTILRRLYKEMRPLAGAIMALMGPPGFPSDVSHLKPTTLGNRTASLDEYARLRYGIDTGILWSRLQPSLDDEKRAHTVGESQLAVQVMVNLAWGLGGLAVVALVTGLWELGAAWLGGTAEPSLQAGYVVWPLCPAAQNLDYDLWPYVVPSLALDHDLWPLVVPSLRVAPSASLFQTAWLLSLGFGVLCLALARLAYNGALYAYDVMGLRMTALIDLHRNCLVKKLVPDGGGALATDVKVLKAYNGFLVGGELSPDLDSPPSPPPSEPASDQASGPAPSSPTGASAPRPAGAGGEMAGTEPPLTQGSKASAPPKAAPKP